MLQQMGLMAVLAAAVAGMIRLTTAPAALATKVIQAVMERLLVAITAAAAVVAMAAQGRQAMALRRRLEVQALQTALAEQVLLMLLVVLVAGHLAEQGQTQRLIPVTAHKQGLILEILVAQVDLVLLSFLFPTPLLLQPQPVAQQLQPAAVNVFTSLQVMAR
jgi:hypothetical protein